MTPSGKEKMCEYCNLKQGERNYISFVPSNVTLWIEHEESGFRLNTEFNKYGIKDYGSYLIYYCPKCGRNLTEGEEK